MALKHNIIANYIGRVYLVIMGIIMVPIYLHYLGAEAYGLVGFFILVESWMLLLDIGLSPTIAREVSKTKESNSKKDRHKFKYLFHSVEVIFISIAIAITVAIVFNSSWITNNWLNVEHLNKDFVAYTVSLIGIIVGFRFITTLYKSGITASEEQVWYNKANIAITTLRYLGTFIILKYISQDFIIFFEYLLLINLLEFAVYSIKFYKIMDIGRFKLYFCAKRVKPILKFAISIAFTGAIWIFVSQLDKLLLSNILSLKEYGYFAIAAVIPVAILQVAEPIHYAILPRLTALYSQNKIEELTALYKSATQWITIIIFSIAGVVSFYSYELLYAWTGDVEAAKWGKDILIWYALGNSLLTITTLQVYLQIAYGKLKMNILYHLIALFIYSPLVFLVAYNYDVVFVAKLWFTFVLVTFFIWTPIVHKYFAPNMHLEWLFKIILPIFLSTTTYLWIIKELNFEFSENRAILFVTLLLIGAILLIINYYISKIFYKK